MGTDTTDEEFVCELCNEAFETKRELARHTRLVATGTRCDLGW